MSDWGSFVDDTPSRGRPPSGPGPDGGNGAGDEWGSFAKPPRSAPGPGPAGPASTAAADDGWGSFVDDSSRGGPPPPPRPSGVPAPSPEVVASLLTAGETLWAQVDGTVALLGSGCAVTAVYDGEPDGFTGWRPVTVVDPAALTVRPVPLSLAEPPVAAATSVAELYSDTEPLTASEPGRRAAPFPVGQGPDLDALLGRAVEEERERVRAQAAAAARRAEAELAAARRELAERAELAERQARSREERAHEEVRLAQQEAGRQVTAARDEAGRQVAAARDEVARVVGHWQLRAQQAESEQARLAEQLDRTVRAGVQRLVLAGVLAVVAVLLAVVLNGG